MKFVAAHSRRRTDRAHKLSFGHAGATIPKAEQSCTSAGIRALVRNSLDCDQAQRSALGPRVTRMTLVEPVIASLLCERGEDAAYAEMEWQYQQFSSATLLSKNGSSAASYDKRSTQDVAS